MKKHLKIAAAILVVAALLVVAMLWFSPGPKEGPQTIIVKEGSTLTSVARQLDEQGAIPGNATTFRAMAKLFGSGDPIQAGEFQIPRGMSAAGILDLLQHGKPAERRTIAGVYCNRLRIGMKLDADPTVIYPITKGKPLGRRIKKSELESDNPYNTYTHAGLPPGPIANPGRASIAAVLDPAPTKALYFVADGTGGHVFAETLEEQAANVKRWYAIRRSRGEM